MKFLFSYFISMSIKNFLLATATAATLVGCTAKNSDDVVVTINTDAKPQTENVDNLWNINSETSVVIKEEKVIKDLAICLETDSNSYTHTGVLELVNDPENTILEFPLSQLFQRYWNCPHPLAVRWIKKDFRALLWKDWIEDLSEKIPQKLSPRAEKITSNTQYEAWDTLRFALINPDLKWAFPKYLSDQLKEEWFQSFSDLDSVKIAKRIKNQNIKENAEKKADFIYDIVIKKLPTWEWALALYRDWELFMATYVSVWLNSTKTTTTIWQHEIIEEDAYKRSITHHNAPMSFGLHFYKWEWTHQWNVTKHPASLGCVRQPGVYADICYSLIYPVIKNKKHVDVFISKNLYN